VRVTFNELAEREFNDAAQYYELKQPGLGAALVSEAERCSRELAAHPFAGVSVGGSVRRRLCQRFPYALLDSVDRDAIRILAVMQLKRRPGYWVARR
jgi:plasmid stabilization system protein ParE